jgi:DNA-directed RNA polymerase subunit RPC12/RpoP
MRAASQQERCAIYTGKGISLMAVKYHCRKCGKRFIDWGAEKLGFKCPDCDNEELVRVGASEDKVVRKPSLKRRARRAVPTLHATEDDVLVPDIEEIEAEEVEVEVEEEEVEGAFAGADDDVAPAGLDIEEVLPVEELAEGEETADLGVADELAFENTTPIGEDVIDEPIAEADEWVP